MVRSFAVAIVQYDDITLNDYCELDKTESVSNADHHDRSVRHMYRRLMIE